MSVEELIKVNTELTESIEDYNQNNNQENAEEMQSKI